MYSFMKEQVARYKSWYLTGTETCPKCHHPMNKFEFSLTQDEVEINLRCPHCDHLLNLLWANKDSVDYYDLARFVPELIEANRNK